MARHTRYQGAIIRDHHILLIKHKQHATGRAYWILPGGGMDGSEAEEDCVIREMKEETNLDVQVKRLIINEPDFTDGPYKWRKTYICRPISGEASPGYEPEPEAAANYSISEVRWFDLNDERGWDESLRQDPITYPQLMRIRALLGYPS